MHGDENGDENDRNRAVAFGAETQTHWRIFDELQRRRPLAAAATSAIERRERYNRYAEEACTGATLGRSVESSLTAAASRCSALNCAAANLRALDSSGQFEVVYLRAVDARRYSPVYTCISHIDVPRWEALHRATAVASADKQRDKAAAVAAHADSERLKALKRARLYIAPVHTPTLRLVTVEPKGAY